MRCPALAPQVRDHDARIFQPGVERGVWGGTTEGSGHGFISIAEVGTNGITHEALLAVLIDRLQSFQRGEYSCCDLAIRPVAGLAW